MEICRTESLPILIEDHIVKVRQTVRCSAQKLGFGVVDQTKIVTAASELARNTLVHGKGGEMTLDEISDGFRKGIRMTFQDHGPGIENINLALSDGYTTGNGMGLGLSGSRRLMDEFQIQSKVGEGTSVTVSRWKTR